MVLWPWCSACSYAKALVRIFRISDCSGSELHLRTSHSVAILIRRMETALKCHYQTCPEEQVREKKRKNEKRFQHAVCWIGLGGSLLQRRSQRELNCSCMLHPHPPSPSPSPDWGQGEAQGGGATGWSHRVKPPSCGSVTQLSIRLSIHPEPVCPNTKLWIDAP